MSSVLAPQTAARYNVHRSFKKSDVNPINPKYFYIIALHMSGKSVKEITELTSLKAPSIYRILSLPQAVQIRQQILKNTQDEFENLFKKVVVAVEAGLDSNVVTEKLSAAQIWLRAHGKYTKEPGDKESATAEDVVKQLMQTQININVNVER